MQFFTEAAAQLPAVKELRIALSKGITPVSLTGVSIGITVPVSLTAK